MQVYKITIKNLQNFEFIKLKFYLSISRYFTTYTYEFYNACANEGREDPSLFVYSRMSNEIERTGKTISFSLSP